MLTLYLNTITGEWYDADGNGFRNGSPSISIKSRETIKVICVTASADAGTDGCDPTKWTRDTHYASLNSASAVLTCDSDYQHYLKGALAVGVSAGTQTIISGTISGVTLGKIKPSGTLRLFASSGEYDALAYSSRTVSGGTVTFDVTGGTTTRAYAADSAIDCDQSPYCEAFAAGTISNLSEGEFGFELVADSARIREECDYASVSKISIAGLEFLPYYLDANNNTIRCPRFLCDTFSIVGVQGNPDGEADLPDATQNQIASVIDAKIGGDVAVNTSVVGGTTYGTLVLGGVGGTSNAFMLPKGDNGDSAYATVSSSAGTATIVCGITGGTETSASVTSASATVIKSGTVATIVCVAGGGTTTATVSDGVDGEDGEDGEDGIDSSATVVKSGTVATITCVTGGTTTTATISDGHDGAIITGAGTICLAIAGDTATCVNTISGGTRSLAITGGTAIELPYDFLSAIGDCEYDLVDPDGYNISATARRGWLSDFEYTFILADGWADGETYYAKPCGIKGANGTVQVIGGTGLTVEADSGTVMVAVDFDETQKTLVAGANITIEGNTISSTGGTSTAGSGIVISGNTISANLHTGSYDTDQAFVSAPFGTLRILVDNATIDTGTEFLAVRLPDSDFPERGGIKRWTSDTLGQAGLGIDIDCDIFGGTASLADDHTALAGKQNALVAGANITLDGNTISASGGGSSYTAGDGISIVNNSINVIVSSASPVRISPSGYLEINYDSGLTIDSNGALFVRTGNGITFDNQSGVAIDINADIFGGTASLSDLLGKQDALVAGANITLNGNTISSTGGGGEISGGNGVYASTEGGSTYIGLDDSYFYVLSGSMRLSNAWAEDFTIDGGTLYIAYGGLVLNNGETSDYFGAGDIQHTLTAGDNITISGNTISASGGSAETEIVELSGTTVTEAGKIYLYTPAAGDVITFFTPESGVDNSFELDVQQGATAVSFTLPTVTWTYGTPDLSAANMTVRIKFRYVNSAWEAWATPEMSDYLKKVDDSVATLDIRKPAGSSYFSIIKAADDVLSGFPGLMIGGDTYLSRTHSFFSMHFAATRFLINYGDFILLNNNRQNTKGGFCISDATTGNITSPGDVIATIGGTTHSMSELLSRIEALENA